MPPSLDAVLSALDALGRGEFLTEDQHRVLSDWGHLLPEATIRFVGRWHCRRLKGYVFCSLKGSGGFCTASFQFQGREIRDYGLMRTEVVPFLPRVGISLKYFIRHGVRNGTPREVRTPVWPVPELQFYMLLNDIAASM